MDNLIIEPRPFISGAILRYPPSQADRVSGMQDHQFTMVICDSPAKRYSLCTKLTLAQDEGLSTPVLQVDKNITGPLTKGDNVTIRRYDPPSATQVTIVISNRLFLVEGNWGTKIVNPATLGQVMDVGGLVEFMYGSEKPMFVEAVIKSTVPKAPAVVTASTTFVVEKMDMSGIANLQVEADRQKEVRANAYIEQLRNEVFDLNTMIRNQSADEYRKTFKFANVYPKNIYVGIRQALGTFKLLTEVSDEFPDESFVGTLVGVPRSSKKPDRMVEFQVRGKMMGGEVSLSIFTMERGKAQSMSGEWEKLVRGLEISMKETPQAIPDVCMGCNARLDITSQNENGIVFCDVCNTPNQLPIALRTD